MVCNYLCTYYFPQLGETGDGSLSPLSEETENRPLSLPKDWWEFPGGKVESGETPEQALKREIKEELDTEIEIEDFLITVEYDYPKFHLIMDCFICSVIRGQLTLLEHEAAKWLPADDMWQVKWLEADIKVIEALEMKKIESSML